LRPCLKILPMNTTQMAPVVHAGRTCVQQSCKSVCALRPVSVGREAYTPLV